MLDAHPVVPPAALRAAVQQHAGALLRHANVFGVGVGIAYRDGQPTGEVKLVVYVERKLPLEALAPSDRVPAVLPVVLDERAGGGTVTVPTDVRQAPRPQIGGPSQRQGAGADLVDGWTARVRPVQPGFSIGHTGDATGSLGAIVVNAQGLHFLSNAHVFVPDPFATGQRARILQPGLADGGVDGHDYVGDLVDYEPYSTTRDNQIDAALARPARGVPLSARYPHIGELRGHYDWAPLGWRLRRVGRTTSYVEAHVTGIWVTLAPANVGRPVRFVNQTVLDHLALPGQPQPPAGAPGDSGSVWVSEDGRACLLNFAGRGDVAFGTPIGTVLGRFGNARLWSGTFADGALDGGPPDDPLWTPT